MYNAKLTIFDIEKEQIKTLDTGIFADQINIMDENTILLTSSLTQEYVEVNVKMETLERKKGQQITHSNIVFNKESSND